MRALRPLAWLLLLVVGSLAMAGLVVTLDHPPNGGDRPELTGRDAAVLAPRLAAIAPSLDAMGVAAGEVSAAGRDALSALRAGDAVALPAALDAGDAALDRLTAAAAVVRDAQPGLLAGLGDGSGLPAADRARVAAVAAATDGVEAIAGAWQDAGEAMLLPAALVSALDAHRDVVDRAAEAGRDARYGTAAGAIDDADAALEEVRSVRERIAAAGRPTGTLDGLLGRLADRDAALGTLYAALVASDGVRTADVEAALAAVDATTAALGSAEADLAAAVGEAGASVITDALLSIEDGRGAIEAALGGS